MATRKKAAEQVEEVFELSSGVQFKVVPMNNVLVYDAQKKIAWPDPIFVKVKIKGEDRMIENPDHPIYRQRVDEAERDRNMAAISAMIMHGVEMISPLPENDKWLQRLRHTLDLSAYEDEDNEIDEEDRRFLYMRYIAVRTQDDFALIARVVLPSEEGVGDEIGQFPGNEG